VDKDFNDITHQVNKDSHLKNVIGNGKDIPDPNYNEKYYQQNPKLNKPRGRGRGDGPDGHGDGQGDHDGHGDGQNGHGPRGPYGHGKSHPPRI